MDRSSDPQAEITIAWATPVSLGQLGAQLEAYAETKAAITTFRFAAKHSEMAALFNLPEEIISMIAGRVRDAVAEHQAQKWTRMKGCFSNNCSILSHMLLAELDMELMIYSHGTDYESYELAEMDAEEDHQEALERYCKRLTNLNGSSRFAKCVRIFTQDLGIRPYFLLHKSYEVNDDNERHGIASVQARAFLTLPLHSSPISSDTSPGATCISVCKTVDPTAFQGLSESQLQKFHIATKILNFRPYQVEKNDISPEDKPWMRKMSRDGWDYQRWVDVFHEDGPESKRYYASCCSESKNVNSARRIFAKLSEPRAKWTQTASIKDVEIDNEEGQPQLMILGCGEFEV